MSPARLTVIATLLATACGLPLNGKYREVQDGYNSVLLLGKPHEKEFFPSVGRLRADSSKKDPDISDQILKVNEHLLTGQLPSHSPPIIFGDIAVDPLGNSDRCNNERAVIESGLQSFSSRTCIRFQPRNNEQDFISIESQSGCFSFIGRNRGLQVVSLQRQGCVFKGIVQHELLHALGFHHEQNRSDRDGFVDIFFENIMPGMESNFRKVNTNNLGTRYDYNSIMHYGRTAFSRNRRPTIVPKPDPNVNIGNRQDFSPEDITKVNRLYCSREWNRKHLLQYKTKPEEEQHL